MRARPALLAISVLAVLFGCRQQKSVEPTKVGPRWATVSGEGWSVELPGPATREVHPGDAGVSTVYEVHSDGGVYALAHLSSPALASTQNRRLVSEAVRAEVSQRLGALQRAEREVKIEAGRAGLSWDAHDLELEGARGAACSARDVFARDHYLLLAACAPPGAKNELWPRVRDSLTLTLDPMAAVGAFDSSSWATWSPDGKTRLLQRSSENGRCQLTCERDTKEAWREEAECRGSAKDTHFVADDCERSVLFYDAPPRGTSLLAAKVLSVYARGKLDYDVVGAAVVRKAEVAQRFSHLVQGLGGNSGSKPRYAADGQSVAFTTVEGRPQTVPLVKTASTPPSEEPAPVRPAPVRKKKPRR